MSQYDLSRPVVARVREAADVVAVIGEVVTLRKSGRSFMGLCPFHGERTPSFSVSRDKGTYYCFGCKRGGDVIDFVMEVERLSFAEAVERLAERFGVELPVASPDARRRRDEQASLVQILEAAQTRFRQHLGDDRPRSFLERRGVPLDVAAEFGLGYALAEWRGLYDELRRLFPERSLVAAGLLVEGDSGKVWDRFRDRVTIPIRNARGGLIAFGGRAIGDDMPKYLNSPETALFAKSTVLYALDRAVRSFAATNRAIVVEGYFDCIALQQAGYGETVATLGTALSEHHARELARKVRDVVVCFDGDAAGRTAATAALRTLLAVQLDLTVVLLPEGQDPDVLLRARGKEGFEALLREALAPGEFLLSQMGASRDERRRNLLTALDVVDACPDPVKRYSMRETLARGAGVPVEQLGPTATMRVSAAEAVPSTLPPSGELALLRACLFDLPAEQVASLAPSLPLEVLTHPATRAIVQSLQQLVSQGGTLEISRLTSDIDDREVRRIVAAIEHEVPPTRDEHLKLIMRELCGKHLQQSLARLSEAIADAEKRGEHDRLAQLLREKRVLQKSRSGL